MSLRMNACKLAHEISKRNVFACAYKKTSLKKAWEIVKLITFIKDKCCKLSRDFERLDSEKRTNLISIQDCIEKLYLIMSKYHILDTKQEKCLLDIKYDISTMIYKNDYSNYNKLLKRIPYRMCLFNI